MNDLEKVTQQRDRARRAIQEFDDRAQYMPALPTAWASLFDGLRAGLQDEPETEEAEKLK